MEKIAIVSWATVVSLFTNNADLFGVLMLFMLFDIITGWAGAFVQKRLNSTRSAIGIVKKFVILTICVMSHYLGLISGYEGVETMVLYFWIANESLSILENSSKAGLPIPLRLKKALEQLKGETDEANHNSIER